ncbi:ABC transporter ATP-binding protein [Pseudoalteromonas sp. CO348]|uniref:ABC transporter ATP-binding protein n=1 Tax=Pseudoalteromonas TaxID=53246 RepID=UPI001023115E|nr:MULTISPECIES: ABC transporter ATP-binding protein [Pseudoalteromonas]MCG7540901.1 ABC transporter ATP-binding protein [Pseudoalteromonas sp. OF7H-1]MCG9770146.1 ABC transporter ATP-binding protein [Pseudoalteromonas piscicida]RZF98858.1 ABC transporter ATP-binding protein [Pseudoalteromonas sp. CO348]
MSKKNKTLVKLESLDKVFYTDEVETHALKNINLTIYSGEYIAITGPSGCGKSTLLSLLGLLDTPTKGMYQLAGHDASDIDTDERARIRNKEIGFVFQSFNLISDLTIEENVELPLTYRTDLTADQRRQSVVSALEKVDMAHRAKHYPSQLSGGQQQRVAVARAIAGNPSIILADEPTGNLDSKNAEMVMKLLEVLNKEGATICMVTHDPASAKRTQRIIEVFDGEIVGDISNNIGSIGAHALKGSEYELLD